MPARTARNTAFRPFLQLLLITLACLLALPACSPPTTSSFEEGWIPGLDGPEWQTYEIDGSQAVYQGDIVFPLSELRAWQATIELPRPIDDQWTELHIASSAGSHFQNPTTQSIGSGIANLMLGDPKGDARADLIVAYDDG